jgi:dTDP-4-amino-4,6-dideoxygalactose transaminase
MPSAAKIPFIDLKSQHLDLSDEINEAINSILSAGSFTLGAAVRDFERAFADYCGVSYGIGVGSGTDALHFALRGFGVGPGDEVITVPNTFIATVEAIRMCGARPVFVDIDRDTYLVDTRSLDRAITGKTKAVIPVHLYGQPVDIRQMVDLCAERGIKVIEDACQAHGASMAGVKTGAFGDAACFSFYPTKNLGGIGDGGMVVTNDPALKNRVERYRNHGEKGKNNHVEPGYCSRLHAIQAAILNVKLKYLDSRNNARRHIASIYDSFFENSPVTHPFIGDSRIHVYHLYVIQVDDRESMQDRLIKKGIETAVHYPVPIHLQPAFAYLGYKKDTFPVAEAAAKKILSLPMFSELKEDEVRRVAYEVLDSAFDHFHAA